MSKLTITYVTKKVKISTRSQRSSMRIKSSVLKTSSKLALTPPISTQSILLLSRKLKKEIKIALEAFKKLGYLIKISTKKQNQKRGTKRILLKILLKSYFLGLRRKKIIQEVLNGHPHYNNCANC